MPIPTSALASLLCLLQAPRADVRLDATPQRHAVVHAYPVVAAEASAPRRGTTPSAPLSWITHVVAGGQPDVVCRWFEALPATDDSPPDLLDAVGNAALEAEYPLLARRVYRRIRALDPADPTGSLGLARTYLLLGRGCEALLYSRLAVAQARTCPHAHETLTRSLLLAGRFDEALEHVERALRAVDRVTSSLKSAHGSALFRLRRREAAADAYRSALQLDPLEPEANLRLGSGLAAGSCPDGLPRARESLARAAADDFDGAVTTLLRSLDAAPGHSMAHRLLGEVLLARKARASWLLVAQDSAAEALATNPADLLASPGPDPERATQIASFFPDYPELSTARRSVVRRAAFLFWPELCEVAALGGAHDFIPHDARTTDAPSRSQLRGQRTFDGRIWDDVRGIGGLHAATGIEALDDPAQLCFDTLAHEVAHQVHLFAFSHQDRARIRDLYHEACATGGALDYYARTNESEYFAQGVEAFVSLAKRPGRQVTHGHTRFELWRRDPALHDFIAGKVARDPLRHPADGQRLLERAIRFALACGRTEDAVAGASWLTGPRAEALRRESARLALLERSH